MSVYTIVRGAAMRKSQGALAQPQLSWCPQEAELGQAALGQLRVD